MKKLFGGGDKGPSKEQKAASARQAADLKKLEGQEAQRVAAAKRKKQGRASLISGEETGLSDTLG